MAKQKSGGKAKRTVISLTEAGDIDGLRALVADGIDVNEIKPRDETSALVRAIEAGNLEMVQALLDLGHKPNWGGIVHPLAQAVREGNRPMVDLLLERGATVDDEEEEGDTAIMYAAGRGDVEFVKLLLDAGADIAHKNREGNDALDFASRGTSREMLDFLFPLFPEARQAPIRRQAHLMREKQLEAGKRERERRDGANQAAGSSQRTPDPPLIKAFSSRQHEQLLKMLAEGANPNETNYEGTSLLAMLCASWSGIELVEPVLKAGAGPNRDSKFVPLQQAAANGAESVVRLLLDHRADVNARSAFGRSALMSAAGSGNIDVVRMLLDAGADPNAEDDQGITPYRQAIERNNDDIAELLRPLTKDVEAAEKPWRANKEGKTRERRLLVAAEAGDVEFVRQLLAEGVSPDIADESFDTPLHRAAENGHVDVINALLEAEAPLEVPGCMDLTPLLAAIRTGEVEAVRRLVDAGASLSVLDSDGRDPVAFAKQSGRDEVAEFLASRG